MTATSFLFYFTGRCARAGRSGTAYSLIAPEEYSYLLDLHLFLGRPLKIVSSMGGKDQGDDAAGRMPQELLEEQQSVLINWHETYADLVSILFYIIRL